MKLPEEKEEIRHHLFFHRLSFKNQNQIETTRNIISADFVGRRIIRKRTSPPKLLSIVAAVMVEVLAFYFRWVFSRICFVLFCVLFLGIATKIIRQTDEPLVILFVSSPSSVVHLAAQSIGGWISR